MYRGGGDEKGQAFSRKGVKWVHVTTSDGKTNIQTSTPNIDILNAIVNGLGSNVFC